MLIEQQFNKFKNKIETNVLEPKMLEKLNDILLHIENNIFDYNMKHRICIGPICNKNYLLVEYFATDTEKVSISGKKVEYEQKNNQTNTINKGKYYLKNGQIVVEYSEAIEADDLEKLDKVTTIYDQYFNKIYVIEELYRKDYILSPEGSRIKLMPNTYFELSNCHIKKEIIKISENAYVKIVTKEYIDKAMKNKEGTFYYKGDGIIYNQITKEEYDNLIEEILSKDELKHQFNDSKTRRLVYKTR